MSNSLIDHKIFFRRSGKDNAKMAQWDLNDVIKEFIRKTSPQGDVVFEGGTLDCSGFNGCITSDKLKSLVIEIPDFFRIELSLDGTYTIYHLMKKPRGKFE